MKDCINSSEALALIALVGSLWVCRVLLLVNLIMIIRRKVTFMSQQSDRIEAAALRLVAAAAAIRALIETLKANQRDPAEVRSLDASGASLDQTVADFESLLSTPASSGGTVQPQATPTGRESSTNAGTSDDGSHSFLVEGK